MICCCSVTQTCLTVCDPLDCSIPGFPVFYYLQVCSNSCPSSQWCHPTISSSVVPFSCLQSFPASGSFPMSQLSTSGGQNIGVYLGFSISPSNESSKLIFFRMDWFDPLAVQGTLKSFLQHHSSKAPVVWHSDLFMIQLSPPYMNTGKTTALTRGTFVGKAMCLLLKYAV